MAFLGEIIDGKYEVLREIGRGGMSVVYLAMDKRLNKQWAIKEFRKDKGDESKEMALRALLNEAELMKKLDHPRLPRIVDIIDKNQTVYIVEDYIEGEPLNKVIEEYGAQPQEAVIEWAKQLCEILDYLHTRTPPIIYRDMKPANIVLKPDGSICVLDFGIAREYKEGKSGDTVNIGTRGYAAPEQFGDRGQTDARTDIYSLGVTLYHMVTGHNPSDPPYEIYPIRHWDPTLSSGLEWMIQKCTQLDPNDRFQSCSEIMYVLENLDKFEETYKSKRRRKLAMFFVTAVMAGVFTIGGFLGIYLGNKEVTESYEYRLNTGTIDSYVQALEIDESRPDAYIGLADELTNKINTIRVDTSEKETLPEGELYYSTINLDYFSQARLSKLRQTSLEDYIKVNYQLGNLIWLCYDTPKAEDRLSAAEKYFENVLDGEQELAAQAIASPLTEKQSALAKSYYMISVFFRLSDKMMSNEDETFTLPEKTARLVGIPATIDDPFETYFQWCQELLDMTSEESGDVTPKVRLSTVELLAAVIYQSIDEFYDNKVDAEDIAGIYRTMYRSVSTLSDSSVDNERRDTLLRYLEDTVAEKIKALYKDIVLGGTAE